MAALLAFPLGAAAQTRETERLALEARAHAQDLAACIVETRRANFDGAACRAAERSGALLFASLRVMGEPNADWEKSGAFAELARVRELKMEQLQLLEQLKAKAGR